MKYMPNDVVEVVKVDYYRSDSMIGQRFKVVEITDRLVLDVDYCPWFEFWEVKLYKRPFKNHLRALLNHIQKLF